nr:polymorphic toxin type 44 domain-containing protein [Chryseobacterium oryctis]
MNNPIRFIDPTGMIAEDTKVKPPNDYIFDEKGNYVRTEKNNQPHRLVIENSKTKDRTNYSFADPKEDAKQIDRGIINKVVFVSEKDIQGMLKKQGAFESGKFNFAWESQGGGDFDYSYSVLPSKYAEASSDPLNSYSNALFLPEGDTTAHNQMNFGNYLWGATGYTVGFDYAGLQMGAHANSKFNSRRNGYESQWDSKDDQRSIILGATHAKRGGYRSIPNIISYGKTHKNSY